MQYQQDLQAYCQTVDIVPRPALPSKIRAMLALFRPSLPLTLPYFYSPKLKVHINQRLSERNYDLIFVFCSSMAQYVGHVQQIPRVIDFVDVDSEKWMQYASNSSFPRNLVYRLESRRLRKYEAVLAKDYQYGFFVSQQEVQDFQTLVHSCPTLQAVPNGVDGEFFHPSKDSYDSHSLVFTGAMDYFANVDTMVYFCEKILPLIRQKIPETILYIVGSHPSAEVRRLAERHANVIVTGFVDKIQPYMAKAAAFVAPMQIARGVQNKILEAMAMGLPVVTNSLGLEGTTATPGYDILKEDRPEAFADRVIQLMNDASLRQKISINARKTVEKKYNWQQNMAQLEQVLLEVKDKRL